MVKNQKEFNNTYSKEKKEIKIEDKYEFEGQLVVEDYSDLEKLYLHDICSIEKITLKNLPQLKECTIWDCDLKELIIVNCSQIKKLNIRQNNLTSLEFLKNLESLKELEINGNTELVEVLKSYQGDWKAYQKDLQELIQLTNQNPQKLLKNIQSLKEEINRLKEKQPVTIDSPDEFQKKYQKLKGNLHFLTKKEELKSKEIDKLVTDEILGDIKDLKEDLSKTQKTKAELEERLAYFERLYLAKKQEIEQKEKELEELKNNLIEKAGNYSKEKLQKRLVKLLKFQVDITTLNAPSAIEEKEEIKGELVEETLLDKGELDEICQLQEQIIKLKLEIQKNFNKVNQIFNINSVGNYIENYSPHSGSITNFLGSKEIETIEPQVFDFENKIEVLPKSQANLITKNYR